MNLKLIAYGIIVMPEKHYYNCNNQNNTMSKLGMSAYFKVENHINKFIIQSRYLIFENELH